MIENRDLVERIMIAAQKARSNIMELDGVSWKDEDKPREPGAIETLCETLNPWLFGEKNILKACEILLEQDPVTAIGVYNLLLIASELEPLIRLSYELRWHEDLPDPHEYLQEALVNG